MDIRGKKIVAFSYMLTNGELKVKKTVFDSCAG